jgi:hypothetical protein
MSALEIQPHSREASTLAVAFLSLLAAGAFVAGLDNQLIGAGGRSPFPAASAAAPSRVAEAIPEAAPAPDMQRAEAAPGPRHAAAPDPSPTEAVSAEVPAPAAAEAPPAVDAAATAPETAPAPPPPAPDNTEPPT